MKYLTIGICFCIVAVFIAFNMMRTDYIIQNCIPDHVEQRCVYK